MAGSGGDARPASRRGVAHEWRNVGPEARVWIPRARRAARKASCTRWRGMGVEAGDLPSPRRPGAGKSHPGWRGGCQDWRSIARVGCGSGTSRSFAPLPSRTWTTIRARAIAGPCRGVPSCSRRPQAERGLRQARERGHRTHWRLVWTASRLRMIGSWGCWGGRTQGSVVHARLRV
jgi:hypothetical protein